MPAHRYAVAALICDAATQVGIDPDTVTFKRTACIVRSGPPTRRPSP